MYELLKMCAANIHTKEDWTLIFCILQYVGAGIDVPKNHLGMYVFKKSSIFKKGIFVS